MKACPPMLQVMPRAVLRKDIDYATDDGIHTTDPDWLPAPNSTIFACQVICMTYSSNKPESQKIATQQSRPGRMISQRDSDGHLKYAIAVEEPFCIDEATFYASEKTTRKTVNRPRWHDKHFAANALKISITFDHPADAALFEAEHGYDIHESQGDALMLRATWLKLPTCPSDGRLIQAFITRGGTAEALQKWCFRIDVAWSSPSETALQIVGRATQSRMKEPVSDPSDTDGLTPGQMREVPSPRDDGRHRVTYEYTDGVIQTRCVSKDTLKCMFCDSRPAFGSLDSLHFHYKTCHEHFRFDVLDRRQMPDGTTEDIFAVNMAHPKDGRTRNGYGAVPDIDWIRPRLPFDLHKYLAGDMAWVEHRLRPAKRKRTQRGGSVESRPVHKDLGSIRACGPKFPAQLPKRQRTGFKVPSLSGVTFFRTESKRFVQAGEVLEESDDDIEDDWLRSRQVHRQAGLPDSSAIRFTVLYNEHMGEETPLGNMYLRRTMLRFTQKHRDVLRQRDMLAVFEKKLDELQNVRKITGTVKNECMAVLDNGLQESTADDT